MAILDSQVHAYERNHSGRPWIPCRADLDIDLVGADVDAFQ